MVSKRVTSEKYQKCLNEIIQSGDVTIFKESSKTSTKIIMVYCLALIISIAVFNSIEDGETYLPIAVVVLGLGLLREIYSKFKNKKEYRKRSKPIIKLIKRLESFQKIQIDYQKYNLTFTLENNDIKESIDFTLDNISSLYNGLGKYLILTSKKEFFILPNTVLKKSDYQLIYNDFNSLMSSQKIARKKKEGNFDSVVIAHGQNTIDSID